MAQELKPGDALLIVDVQNDFLPGGALPVPEGDKVVPVLNEWIAAAREANIPVYASRDWHPFNHMSFEQEGGIWPPHCVQDTPGAQFYPELDFSEGEFIVLNKGSHPDKEAYSAFDGTELEERLKKNGIKRLWVGGLAQDYCVRETVIHAAQKGFEVHLILPATRPISEETGQKALEDMRKAGAVVEEQSEPRGVETA